MRKLKLKLDDLRVKSFPTAAAVRSAGTVMGYLDFEVEGDPAAATTGPTGTTCMMSQNCPLNSFSCFCYTGAFPDM